MRPGFKLEGFLPFRLNVLAQEVSTRLSAIYAERFGLDIPQWRILANLATRGDLTAQEIARITFSHKSTISRAVGELEGRKLIQRAMDPEDGRALVLRLTPKGRVLFAELLPLVLAFEKELLGKLGQTDAKALLKGLTAIERTLFHQIRGNP
jgi:DNA-binding MarR family transcriptional regulator